MIATLLAAPPVQPVSDPTSTYVIMVGATVIFAYMMMRMNARKKRGGPMDRPFASSSLAQQRSTERQMENLLVEFSNMSREISAQLDTRATKLEILIQDADERIARMQELADRTPARPAFAMPTQEASPPSSSMRIVPIEETPPPATPVEEPPPEEEIDPGHAAIYKLADEGKSSGEIATAVGRHSGEVELILALRPR